MEDEDPCTPDDFRNRAPSGVRPVREAPAELPRVAETRVVEVRGQVRRASLARGGGIRCDSGDRRRDVVHLERGGVAGSVREDPDLPPAEVNHRNELVCIERTRKAQHTWIEAVVRAPELHVLRGGRGCNRRGIGLGPDGDAVLRPHREVGIRREIAPVPSRRHVTGRARSDLRPRRRPEGHVEQRINVVVPSQSNDVHVVLCGEFPSEGIRAVP